MIKGVADPSYRKRTGYHAGLLGGIAMMTSAILVVGHLETHDAIAERLAEDMRESLAQVIPPALHDNQMLEDVVLVTPSENAEPIKVYRSRLEHQVTGVAYQVSGMGYAGAIHLIMGVNSDGAVLGVRVISHAETPGLGDKIEEKKSDWINGFSGQSLQALGLKGWGVKKDGGHFDQFSGATITPRAVVKAVKEGLEFFNIHRAEMIGTGGAPATTDDPLQGRPQQ